VGGFVGYFGYELKRLTTGVDTRASKTPDACFYFVDRFIAVDHLESRAYLVALAEIGDPSQVDAAQVWFDAIAARIERASQAAEQNTRSIPSRAKPVEFRLQHGKSAYIKRINECLDELQRGESYEICLTNEIVADVSVEPLYLYRILRARNPAPYAAFLRFDGISIVCSSPERFLKVSEAGEVESKPIKGTSPRGKDALEDNAIKEALSQDVKSQSENLMIVDLLRNDLGRVCEIGSVHVPALMKVETYATVHQLVSTVRGQLRRGTSVIDCVQAAFPGGSMTGAPKCRTLEIIDRLEGRPRGVYSGSIGFLSLNGAADLNIVIRTVVVKENEVSIGCGGAIVALSDPQEEFAEILLKARAPMLAIVEAACGHANGTYSLAGADDQPLLPDNDDRQPFSVRIAEKDEAPAVVQGVLSLLIELGGPSKMFSPEKAIEAAEYLLAHRDRGLVFLLHDNDQSKKLVGLCSVSFVHAIRTCGMYALIQELWVDQAARSRSGGRKLIQAAASAAELYGAACLEVGLPTSAAHEDSAVRRFYVSCGFTQLGPRMRLVLA
jgi:para-aminobenzoate synthetase